MLDEDDVGTCILLVDQEYINVHSVSKRENGLIVVSSGAHNIDYIGADSQANLSGIIPIAHENNQKQPATKKKFTFVDSQIMDEVVKAKPLAPTVSFTLVSLSTLMTGKGESGCCDPIATVCPSTRVE